MLTFLFRDACHEYHKLFSSKGYQVFDEVSKSIYISSNKIKESYPQYSRKNDFSFNNLFSSQLDELNDSNLSAGHFILLFVFLKGFQQFSGWGSLKISLDRVTLSTFGGEFKFFRDSNYKFYFTTLI